MMYKQVLHINASIILMLIIGLYAGMADAHGNVPLNQDSCVRGEQGSKVHLSTYQPQNEPIAHDCSEIPTEGEVFFVVDLIDQALRNMPVAMRIVRGTSETEDETVSILHADYHPDGVIGGRTNLDQGNYTVFITGESVPPVHYQYPLRVQQINYAKLASSAIGPLIFSLLLILLGYRLVRSQRIQNWLSSRRP
jgi:hypothetical protein